MSQQPSLYRGYRFPPAIIAHTVCLYHRFGLSCRNVEDLLAERGIIVTYETIRQWRLTFGLEYARRLWTQRGRQGGIWMRSSCGFETGTLLVAGRGRRQ
jgi:putative transposase